LAGLSEAAGVAPGLGLVSAEERARPAGEPLGFGAAVVAESGALDPLGLGASEPVGLGVLESCLPVPEGAGVGAWVGN
jgi:hypothetical protein